MRITFTNFRCHVKRAFDFPETGVVLVSGGSGVGKSTILKGILFALYGPRAVKKPCTFGSTKATVALEIAGFSVMRSSRPRRLVVNERFEDDVAQEMITQRFGTLEQFMISSFIPQKNNSSILSQTPTEQIRMIRILADLNDRHRDRIQELIREANQRMLEANADLKVKREQLDKLRESFIPVETDQPLDDDCINKYQHRIQRFNSKITGLRGRYESAAKNLAIKKSLSELERDLKETRPSADIADLRQRLESCRARERIAEIRSELWRGMTREENETQIADLDVAITEQRRVAGLRRDFQKVCKKYGLDGSRRVSELMAVERQKHDESLSCPNCYVALELSDDIRGGLVQIETANKPLIDALEQVADLDEIVCNGVSVKELETQRGQLFKRLTRNLAMQQELDGLLERNPDSDAACDRGSVAAIERQIREQEERRVLHLSIRQRIDKLRRHLKNPNVTKSVVERLKTEIEALEEEHRQDMQMSGLIDAYKRYVHAKSEIEDWEQRVEDAAGVFDESSKQHTATLVLKERYIQAELIAIREMIDVINSNTKFFLDTFFPDDALTVILSTSTDSLKVATEITYRGEEYDDISQLSGGEFDRCTLASVCALNSILCSPILILDESLSALDSATNTEILGFLREIGDEKLVLVCSHEAVRGIFDEEIAV